MQVLKESAAGHTSLLVGGEWMAQSESIAVRSPYSGDLLGNVGWGGADDITRSVEAGARAMRDAPLEPFERADLLEEVAQLVAGRAGEIALTLSAEAGKPVRLAQVEVARATETFKAAAAAARELCGEVIPIAGTAAGSGRFAFTTRVPAGVVAAITPFNFPLNLVAHKVAPAIAGGCAVVLKPADKAPLTALALAHLLEEAGLPPGWLSVVLAEPEVSAAALLDSPDVALLTFTGASRIGWGLAKRAERTRVSLELGNSTPLIVTETADLEAAARHCALSAFSFAGQACTSAQRAIVARPCHDEFTERLVAEAEALEVGDPADPHVDVGPLITEAAHDRTLETIARAEREGAEVLTGGRSLRRQIIEPTVLDAVAPDSSFAIEELFGPAVGIVEASTTAEAIEFANATRYGLSAAIFTDRASDVNAAASRLEFGSVMINDSPSLRSERMPYGGIKDSGNAKEGPARAVLEMTEERLIVVRQ